MAGAENDFLLTPEKRDELNKKREQAIKEKEMKFHKKVVAIYKHIEPEDLETLVRIVEETKGYNPHEKIKTRKKRLFPLYKKYVDPRAKLNSGCGSCVKAQSSFFEQLIKYHNVQEAK